MSARELLKQAEFNMQVCNACRYCEGLCAVFPAMERRLSFSENDLHYLANLCHQCGACYYDCQYAPPHEFNVNIPRNFAELRGKTYQRFAWPAAFANFFDNNGTVVSIVTALSIAVLFLMAFYLAQPGAMFAADATPGSFYRILSHNAMVGTFMAVGIFVFIALVVGFLRFWRYIGEDLGEFFRPVTLVHGIVDVLKLRYLDGDGEGCNYPGEDASDNRRVFHHFTFYGFLLCFAATAVGTIYHYVFQWDAPYAYSSLPVILGTLGGIGLLVGPAGLLWLKARRDYEPTEPTQLGMDVGFLHLLFFTSLTGLILLIMRATPVMGVLLALHLGFVLALFLTLPYGKFVHAVYRFAAVVRYALERSRPAPNVTFE